MSKITKLNVSGRESTVYLENKQLKASIQRVRELHKPIHDWAYECAHCSVINGIFEAVFYPCPTIKALDGEQ